MTVIQEREAVFHEFAMARDQLENLHKHHENYEAKSKSDVKLLVKEVKSLRNSQSELKQEMGRLMKENIEAEVICILFFSQLIIQTLKDIISIFLSENAAKRKAQNGTNRCNQYEVVARM